MSGSVVVSVRSNLASAGLRGSLETGFFPHLGAYTGDSRFVVFGCDEIRRCEGGASFAIWFSLTYERARFHLPDAGDDAGIVGIRCDRRSPTSLFVERLAVIFSTDERLRPAILTSLRLASSRALRRSSAEIVAEDSDDVEVGP